MIPVAVKSKLSALMFRNPILQTGCLGIRSVCHVIIVEVSRYSGFSSNCFFQAKGWATLNFNRLPSPGSTHSHSSTQITSLYSILTPPLLDMTSTNLINLRTFELEPFVIGQMPPCVAASHVWSEILFPVSAISSISKTPGM